MTIRLSSTLPAVLALLAAPLWLAQASAQTSAPAQPAVFAAAPAAAPPGYRSAFEGYRPYTDEKTVNWKEANDTAARIGGWREYAREASQKQPPADAASAPGAKP